MQREWTPIILGAAAAAILAGGVTYAMIRGPAAGGAIPVMIVLLGVVLSVYVVWRHNRGRRELISSRARELGLSIAKEGEVDAAELRRVFGWDRVMGERRGRIGPAYAGRVGGTEVEVMQHQYTVHAGHVVYAVVHSVGILRVPGWWPRMVVIDRRMKGMWEKWRERSEVLTGRKRFDRRFDVHGEDHEFAAAMLGEEMMSFLEGLKHSVSFEIREGVLLWKSRQSLTPDRLQGFVHAGLQFAALIPRELWDERDEGAWAEGSNAGS